MLYNSTPGGTGGFAPQRSTSAGYVDLSQALPYYHGRSQIASIPEYERNPGLLSKDILMTITEGNSNFMRLLYEYAEQNGSLSFPDVKFRWRVEIVPHGRFYLNEQAFTVSGGRTTFKLSNFTRPTQSYPTSTGNPKVVGNIARIEPGDYMLLMCSWLAKTRLGANSYREAYTTPVPEIIKVISVDYAANSFVGERNWAGAQRTGAKTAPSTFTVVANSTASPSASQVIAKNAFLLLLPRSMKEDDIDARVHGYSQTWQEGLMQRSLRAWGAGYFQEVINRNLGRGSQLDKNRKEAVKNFYDERELAALFGEKDEGFDPETGDWWGLTDGLLTNIPSSHWWGLVPMDYGNIRQNPKYAWGSWDIPILNKILEDKGYYGSSTKVALCGQEAFTSFAVMINYMTQNVPEIKSEWKVTGRRFVTSGGLTVDFVPSDKMTLNGMRNKMILMDPSAFRKVNLTGYPDSDIIEVQNENPLKQNGFIHGVFAFLDLNPDAHWVFTLDSALASTTGATYADNVMGIPLEV